MKIEGQYTPPTTTVASRAQQRPTPEAQASTAAEAVHLSPLAGTLQGNEKPPVNNVRIQEIKAAIAKGEFKINSGAIADRLIETARDLLKSDRQA